MGDRLAGFARDDEAATALPYGLLAFGLLVSLILALVNGEELTDPVFTVSDASGCSNFFCDIFDTGAVIVNGVWAFVQILFATLTFDVPGAPWWIRVPIATYLIFGIGYVILNLVFDAIPG